MSLIAVASPGAEHGLQELWHPGSGAAAHRLQGTGSAVAARSLGRSAAGGIRPDQGPNLCILHWRADSLPPSHQGSPKPGFFN